MAEISKIDYKLGQDNVQFLGLDIHNPVFVVSSLTIIAFVAGVLAFQAEATAAFGALRAGLMSTFDWVFMGAGNLFVLFCLLLMVTPPGRVRLGGADARPDYSRSAWFAMLFAAGMGIGLMFFGVSEPVEHFLQPPLGLIATGVVTSLGQYLAAIGPLSNWVGRKDPHCPEEGLSHQNACQRQSQFGIVRRLSGNRVPGAPVGKIPDTIGVLSTNLIGGVELDKTAERVPCQLAKQASLSPG